MAYWCKNESPVTTGGRSSDQSTAGTRKDHPYLTGVRMSHQIITGERMRNPLTAGGKKGHPYITGVRMRHQLWSLQKGPCNGYERRPSGWEFGPKKENGPSRRINGILATATAF